MNSTLLKIRNVFEDGYVPSRDFESYRPLSLMQNVPFKLLTNCMGHACFNLTNRMFDDYDFNMEDCLVLRSFRGDAAKLENDAMEFVQQAGLKVEKCQQDAVVKNFGTWKIALYTRRFIENEFHFFIQENPSTWSCKFGMDEAKTYSFSEGLPEQFFARQYQFASTYLISNPNADPQNPYVK